MSPGDYRYYLLDRAGALHPAEWLSANSDEEAIARIKSRHPHSKCEIWQDRRLVASLSPNLGTSLAPCPDPVSGQRHQSL